MNEQAYYMSLVKAAFNHRPNIYKSLQEELIEVAMKEGADYAKATSDVRFICNVKQATKNVIEKYIKQHEATSEKAA